MVSIACDQSLARGQRALTWYNHGGGQKDIRIDNIDI